MLKKLTEILRLCYTPYSIISPFPFFAIIIFLLAYNVNKIPAFSVNFLFAGVVTSLISNSASNVWNHTNDLKEDIAQGKKNALTGNAISYHSAIVLSLLLYLISIIIILYISIKVERPVYLFFFIWTFFTWCYSDNIIFKKLFGFRLKDHYTGELLTYIIACPMYTLTIWLIYSNLNIAGLALALAFLFFGISVVLLKDIKDISGDRKAKLKTFGVVFPPSKLFYFSCIFLLLYYIVILNSAALNIFSRSVLLIAIPFFYFIKNSFLHFNEKKWSIGAEDSRQIKTIVISTYLSIIILGASTFI